MVDRRRSSLAAAASLALALGACADERHFPAGQRWTSSHFRYHARSGDSTVCDGIVERLEEHLRLVGGYLGIDASALSVDYYKFRDLDDLRGSSTCTPGAEGCADAANIQSPVPLEGHELVHTYLMPIGRPPSLFVEGAAEALAPLGRAFVAPPQSWQEILATPPLESGLTAPRIYWAGGWFVSYLLRTFGPSPFLALYAAVPASAEAPEVAAVFEQIYGVSLDATWERARTSAPETPGVPIWECAGDPLVLGGAPADLSHRCDGRGAFATLALSEPASMTSVDARLAFGFNVAGCALDHPLVAEMIGSIGGLETVAVALPAGRYVVAPMAETGSLGLRATPNIPAPDCDAAEPLALPATDGNLTIAAANRETPLFLRIGRPQKPSFELTRSWDHPIVPDKIHATLEICSDCSGGTCRPFDGLTRAPIASGEILRLTGLDAPPGATMIRLRFN